MMNCKINRTKYGMRPAEILPNIIEIEVGNEHVLVVVEQLVKKGFSAHPGQFRRF